MVMEGAPMTADLDGDGDAEVLTAAYENLIAVDGTGKELWRFDTRGRYQTCPAILERDSASPLIFAGDNTGQFTCLDGVGTVVWQAETAPVFCASAALGDLEGNGTMEIVQGDKSGTVNVFDALTGKPVWQREVEGECASPALADLDNDGRLETVIGTSAGKVFALGATGEPIWEFNLAGTTPDWATCSPIVFGNSDGQQRVACASSQQCVYCLDGSGKLLWKYNTRGAVASTLSAGDIDDDGRTDLFAVTQLGVVYRFDEGGRAIWEIDTQGRSLAPGAIIDLDGDGACEYVLCTQNGNLLVFDRDGAMQFSHQFDNRTINVTPAFGDIVKDRPGLEFAVTGGESGRMFCFGTDAPATIKSHWTAYRGNSANAGAWSAGGCTETAGMTPEGLDQDAMLCGSPVRFAIVANDAGNGRLTAEAVCTRPDGTQQRALGRVIEKGGVVELPLTVNSAGTYRIAWRLLDGGGNVVSRGEREMALQPFANDRALVKRAIDALRALVGGVGPGGDDASFRSAIADLMQRIEGDAADLAPLQDTAPPPGPANKDDVLSRTAALDAQCIRAIAIAQLASETDIAGAYLVPFEGAAWENRSAPGPVPASTGGPLRIARRCVVGEHEPVSINLFNASNRCVPPNVRVSANPDGINVTALNSVRVNTNQGGVAWDPLVSVAQGGLILTPLETREVWLDIDLADATPGTHEIDVTIEGKRAQTDVHIALEVLPFAMAGYDAMRMCCWAQYNDNAVKDLLAHGNTVFVTSLPPATVDANTSAVAIDFAALNTFLAPLKGHNVYLLLQGVPALGAPMESDAYVPRFAEYIQQVLAHLAQNGIDEGRVALYTFDEPGGNGWNSVHQYTAFARQALKARPGLKFYVNGGGDLPMFEEMAEYAGVWSPSYYMLPEQSPEMAVLRTSGKTLWSYDCAYAFSRPVGANTKTINVVAQYRFAAMIAMNYGATGIGWWCYNVGPSMWDPIQYEYPLVYANPDKTQTSSRRWEAVREGVEDARILIALREKLADNSVSAAAKEQIRNLLEKTVPDVSRQTMEEARLGVARYVIDATHNDDTVDRLRNDLLDCVAALAK
jgi:outer membrane protein assembly factor BamB